MDVQDLVAKIHSKPHLMVMNFAGAGSQALAWLHSVGGSSRTVLEVVDRYSAPSLTEAVGFTPEQFTSPRVAKALAEHAHARAESLVARLPSDRPRVVFGVGLTATIATDRPKRGDHRMSLAVRDAFGTLTHEIVLTKGERDRASEEALLSRFALDAIASASGVLHAIDPDWLEGEELETEFDPTISVAAFAAEERPWLRLEPDGTWAEPSAQRGLAIMSGNFHPVHEGHFELARVAAEHTGREVVFELPLQNAEKGEVPLLEARRRAAQFADKFPLLLTRAPLFAQKAALFPDTLFVVGADTAVRVVDPAFYGDSEANMRKALETIRAEGGRFLVAGRRVKGEFLTLAGIDVPTGFESLFEGLPEDVFRADISSSDLRREWSKS